jgi:hypothetical protein
MKIITREHDGNKSKERTNKKEIKNGGTLCVPRYKAGHRAEIVLTAFRNVWHATKIQSTKQKTGVTVTMVTVSSHLFSTAEKYKTPQTGVQLFQNT